MKVKDLKTIIEKLPDDMLVASFDSQGSYKDAIAYVDGTGSEDEFPMEWLVIGVVEEELE